MANGVSARRYSAVAILLHWASALAVLAEGEAKAKKAAEEAEKKKKG